MSQFMTLRHLSLVAGLTLGLLAGQSVLALSSDRHQSIIIHSDSAERDAVIGRVRESGPLDVLVVNAGVGLFGDALELAGQMRKALDSRHQIHAPLAADDRMDFVENDRFDAEQRSLSVRRGQQ